MWNQIIEIENVRKFRCNHEYLCLTNNQKTIQVRPLNDCSSILWEKEIKNKTNYHSEIDLSSEILFINNYGSVNLFNLQNGTEIIPDIDEIGELMPLEETMENNIFLFKLINRKSGLVSAYFEDNRLRTKWKKNIDIGICSSMNSGGFFITSGCGKKVLKLDLNTSNNLWEFNLNEIISNPSSDEFISRLLSTENQVIVKTQKGILLALSNKDGSLIWKIDEFPHPYRELTGEKINFYNFKLIKNNKIIFSYKAGTFVEIDVETGEIKKLVSLFELFFKNNLMGTNNTDFSMIDDENFLFFQDRPKNLVSINNVTKKINSITPFAGKGKDLMGPWFGPIVNGNKCFLKDNLGIVYVFQKE